MERNDEPQAGTVPKGTFGPKGRQSPRVDDTQRTFAPLPRSEGPESSRQPEGDPWYEPGFDSQPPQLDTPPVAVTPSGRARVDTLVGIPSAPPELLEQARAQRGSHPVPPSYDELRFSLAAQEASLDSLDMPFTAVASKSAAPAPDPLDSMLDAAFEPWDEVEPLSATPLSAVLDAENAADHYDDFFAEEVTPLRSSAQLAEASQRPINDHPAALMRAHPTFTTTAQLVAETMARPATRPPSPPPSAGSVGERQLGQGRGAVAEPLALEGLGSLAPSERGRAGVAEISSKRKGGVWPVALAAAVGLIGAFGWAYTRPGPQVAVARKAFVAATAASALIVRGAYMSDSKTSVPAATEPAAIEAELPSLPAEAAVAAELPSFSSPTTIAQAVAPSAVPRAVTRQPARSIVGRTSRPLPAAAVEPAEGVATLAPGETPLQASPAPPVLRIVRLDGPQDPSHPDLPGRADVQQAMRSVRGKVAACVSRSGGVAQVTVTALSSGKLNHVLVGGDFSGTPEGSCIARAVRRARLPAFSKPQFEFTYPFSF